MPYVLRPDVETKIPPAFVVQALDDDADGVEDTGAWDALAAAVDAEIDGYLSRRFPLPLSDTPAALRSGACILACEAIHQRRGAYGDKNPFTVHADAFRARLEAIAAGKAELAITQKPARPGISIISESAGTVPRQRLNG